MTKRVLILAPAGLLMAGMQAADQAKVHDILPELSYDVPSTKAVGGKVVIDALVPDSFAESDLTNEFPTWEVIGIFDRNPIGGRVTLIDGVETVEPDLIVHKPLDSAKVLERQNPLQVDDGLGNITEIPATLNNFQRWFNWGKL